MVWILSMSAKANWDFPARGCEARSCHDLLASMACLPKTA